MYRTPSRHFARKYLSFALIVSLLFAGTSPASAKNRYQDNSSQAETSQTGAETPEPPVLTGEDGQDAAPDEGTIYSLPFEWPDAMTIAIEEIDQVAPPLLALQVDGAFEAAFVPTDDDAVADGAVRILSISTGQRHLLLGWQLAADSTQPAIPAGSVVRLSTEARLYSPPGGAALIIGALANQQWGSSSVTMDDVAWNEYSVTRRIDDATMELIMGIDWDPSIDNAWIELRNLRVEIDPVDIDSDAALSPTDTPTPPHTATPEPPTATPTPAATITPTLMVVTSTPTPEDVFAAATHVAMLTEWARVVGTATPTPPNMVIATHTPTPTPTATPIIVTNTPKPGNAATATFEALYAAAVALATGTPTPLPEGAVIQTATPTATPETPQPRAPTATRTPTPFYVRLSDLNPTPEPTPTLPVPDEFIGKIVFLSDYLSGNRNRPNAYVINPDGSDVAVLTQLHFHTRAEERDAWSADNRYFVYARREDGAGNAGKYQIFYDDAHYESVNHQLTYFGAGTAWDPVWSPRGETVALVSSESANDEIWIAQRGQWPAHQITKNDWEWDHHPSFSPDGTQLTFMSNRDSGTRQVWIMDVGGENARQITFLPGAEAWQPVWIKYKD